MDATTYCYLKCIVYDKLLKLRQSFRITLYLLNISIFVKKDSYLHGAEFILTSNSFSPSQEIPLILRK